MKRTTDLEEDLGVAEKMAEHKRGYTPIAHALLEQLAKGQFTAAEYKILLMIIRQTMGYHRVSADISTSDFSKRCNLHFTSVSRALNRLLDRRVVIEVTTPDFSSVRAVALNKNYDEWLAPAPRDSRLLTPSTEANTRASAEANARVSVEANPIKDNYKNNFKNREGKEPPSLS